MSWTCFHINPDYWFKSFLAEMGNVTYLELFLRKVLLFTSSRAFSKYQWNATRCPYDNSCVLISEDLQMCLLLKISNFNSPSSCVILFEDKCVWDFLSSLLISSSAFSSHCLFKRRSHNGKCLFFFVHELHVQIDWRISYRTLSVLILISAMHALSIFMIMYQCLLFPRSVKVSLVWNVRKKQLYSKQKKTQVKKKMKACDTK